MWSSVLYCDTVCKCTMSSHWLTDVVKVVVTAEVDSCVVEPWAILMSKLVVCDSSVACVVLVIV